MEHACLLSAVVGLFALSAVLVAGNFLPAAPILGGRDNVFSRAPLDCKPVRCGRRWSRLRLQRAHVELPDVAEQYRRARLDAAGDPYGGAGPARRAEAYLQRGARWGCGNAKRRAG